METIYVNAADHANLSLLGVAEPLCAKLRRARVVPSEGVPPDVVTMQSRVMLEDQDTGERTIVSLVYPSEANDARACVSVIDALGMELFGARRGELITVPGTGRRLCVLDILYQPEHSMRTHLVVRD